MMATGPVVQSIENLEDAKDYWVYFCNPHNRDASAYRGAFFDTFLGLELLGKHGNVRGELYLRFQRQGQIALHSIVRIEQAAGK